MGRTVIGLHADPSYQRKQGCRLGATIILHRLCSRHGCVSLIKDFMSCLATSGVFVRRYRTSDRLFGSFSAIWEEQLPCGAHLHESSKLCCEMPEMLHGNDCITSIRGGVVMFNRVISPHSTTDCPSKTFKPHCYWRG